MWKPSGDLEESAGEALLSQVKNYVTADEAERKKATEQAEDLYPKALEALAKHPGGAQAIGRRLKHIESWPQIDLKRFDALCVESFVMADPDAAARKDKRRVEMAPSHLAGRLIADLGANAFAEVRQSATCESKPGLAVVRARIAEYDPGGAIARSLMAGAGAAKLTIEVTVANGESGATLAQFTEKGLWAWGGALGAGRDITDLENNAAYEIATYLKQRRGVESADRDMDDAKEKEE